jgi:predicted MFS family arabinose efflux permease
MMATANITISKSKPLWTKNFTVLLIGAISQAISFYFLIPVLPLYVTGPLQSSKTMVGTVVAIFSLTAVTVRPLGGFLLDRYGRRIWLLAASVLFFLSVMSYQLASSIFILMLIRLSHGLSWGVVGVASATVAADIVPTSRRGAGMGFYGMAMPVAIAVGPMVGLWILEDTHFSRLFLAAGLLALNSFICFSSIQIPKIKNESAELKLSNIIETRVLPIFWFMLLLCIGYGGVAAFIPLYVPTLGFSDSGTVFMIFGIGVIMTRFFSGRWYDNSGPLRPILTGLSLIFLGWLGFGIAGTKYELLGGSLSLGLGFGMIMPSVQAMTIDLVEAERRGAANATVFSAFDVGISTGAFGFGLLSNIVEFSTIYLLSSVLAVFSGAIFFLFVHPNYKKIK